MPAPSLGRPWVFRTSKITTGRTFKLKCVEEWFATKTKNDTSVGKAITCTHTHAHISYQNKQLFLEDYIACANFALMSKTAMSSALYVDVSLYFKHTLAMPCSSTHQQPTKQSPPTTPTTDMHELAVHACKVAEVQSSGTQAASLQLGCNSCGQRMLPSRSSDRQFLVWLASPYAQGRN